MRIGIDMVGVERVGRIATRTASFVSSVCTGEEARRAEALAGGRRDAFLAGRLAAKEAALKALGTGIDDRARLREIEVAGPDEGVQVLHLHGSTAALASSLGLSHFLVSISHDGGVALALVVFQ